MWIRCRIYGSEEGVPGSLGAGGYTLSHTFCFHIVRKEEHTGGRSPAGFWCLVCDCKMKFTEEKAAAGDGSNAGPMSKE